MSKRQYRLLVLAMCTAASAAVATAAPAVAAPAHSADAGGCVVSRLPVPPDTWRSDVLAGDPTGRYLIGEAAITGGGLVSLFWGDGALTPFTTPHRDPVLRDVNRHGAIVGYARDTDLRNQAWRYRDGRFTALPGLRPGDDTWPQAMNGPGDVIGYSTDLTVFPPDRRPVIWPADRPGTVREVRVPGYGPAAVTVTDIDDDRTVIGSADGTATYVAPPRGRAYLLRGPAGTTSVSAVGIRNGWIAGSENTDPHAMAVRWNIRTGRATVVADNLPYSVNGLGSVGMSLAIAHRDGRVVTLPSLAGSGIGAPRVLPDRGYPAGFSSDGTNVHAVRWADC